MMNVCARLRTPKRNRGGARGEAVNWLDSEDKIAKDLVDLYHLVNHNREGKTPAQLHPAASRGGTCVCRPAREREHQEAARVRVGTARNQALARFLNALLGPPGL